MRACLVCGAAVTGARRYPGLLRCPRCGFLTADVALRDDELAELYGTDYFHGREYADYVAEQDELRLNFRRRLATLLPLLPVAPVAATLYEVGCAYGFFLCEARRYVASVSGIDIAPEATRYARDTLGLDVVTGDYLHHRTDGPVDAVCLWDTVEHLRDPHLYVRKAAADLRPGGLLALTTGDVDSLNARLRGRRWRMVHPPTHLHYFSRRTIGRLLDDAGFDVVHVEHPGNARTVRSIAFGVIALRAGRKGLYESLHRRLPVMDKAVTLNLRDIMYVIGRRRPR